MSGIELTLEFSGGVPSPGVIDPGPSVTFVGMCRLEGGVDNVKDPDVTSGDTGGGLQGGQWIHSHGPTTFGVFSFEAQSLRPHIRIKNGLWRSKLTR